MLETSLPAEQATPGLCIYLLGPPKVEWAGQPLTIPRRQARALLFYLAARAQTIPRECLHFLFWPDAPESTARRSLTRLLTHLRRALPAPEILLTTEEGIGLNSLRVWSDVVHFERLCAIQKPHDRVSALQQAVQLYRGSLLVGFSLPSCPEFEAWSSQARYTQERLYLDALEALIEACADQGACDEAIAYAQRYLESDELAEKIHRRLIELYAATGNRSAALRQFEACVTILERELGVSPLPETQATYQAVLHGRPMMQPPPPTWTTLPSLHTPLVGREEALNRLERAYTRARSSEGSLVLISGEPGIGKSRLSQEFVSSLQGKATLVVGDGHEAEQGLPYWPLIEALRPHLQSIDWARLDLEPYCLPEVVRILPELRTVFPDLSAPALIESGQERGHLFQALCHWLMSWAAHRPPLILCLDDLHWADETTLAWLGYLSRQIKRAPILVLGVYRAEEAQAVAALRAELARQGVLQEIALEGLPQPEVLRLIRHLSGQTSGAEQFSQRLQRETNGNPFFLLETLRVLFETGVLWQGEAGWSIRVDETTEDYRELPLPDTVSQALRDRLGRLTAQAYQVLEAGAVIGHQFDLDLIRMTSGRRESEVVDALEALMARQVLSEHDGKYRFNHDLIRAVVYRDLSFGRRRRLHRRAGEALVKLRPDDAAALAWHFERAEELGRAAEYALQAGQKAKLVFAHAPARAFFDKALALLEQEATWLRAPAEIAANQRLQIHALDERGWALRLLGDMEAYVRDSQEMARLAAASGDWHTLAQARWREAHAHRWFGRYAEALAAAKDGIQLSRTVGDALCEAICLREVGLAARALGEYGSAKATLERALDLFGELGNAEYEIHVLGNLSTLYLYQGDYGLALDLARRALARCDQAGLRFNRRLALGDMGAVAAATGDANMARQWLMESLEIARQIADRTQEVFCLGHLGWLWVRLKQPKQALEHLQAALALAEAIDSRTEQSWLHSGLAEACRLAGNADPAQIHAQRALELALAYGRSYDERIARQVLATL